MTQVVPETSTASSFLLRPTDSQALPPAAPGQYLTVRIPEEGRPGLVRTYSLSSAPGAAEYRISVKREDRGKVSIYYTAPDLEIAGEPGITHRRMTSDGIRELGIPADTHAYPCGPEGSMSAVTSALQRARLSSSNIHTTDVPLDL
ncbi:hypothetical protein ACFYRG_28230 [Streptomyces mirabilis]|uniref:hypothetical protein n=1 Tax=Streptomyces TaxID=1883 RepID=UPI0033BCA49D